MLQELVLVPVLLEDPLEILLHRGRKDHVLEMEVGIGDAEEPFELSPWLGDGDWSRSPLHDTRLRTNLIDQIPELSCHSSMAKASLMRGELQGNPVEARVVLLAEALDQGLELIRGSHLPSSVLHWNG
jgi:hypothetical protein